MRCSKWGKLIQLQHYQGSRASYWGLAGRTWNFSLSGRTQKISMPFTSRWLYCKCKAESTTTPNREIQNISSFDSPSPGCTWQRWWMSESCNSVQGRHPRPPGTCSPAGSSAQANYFVCKRLRQLSCCPSPILLQHLFKSQPACRSAGLELQNERSKNTEATASSPFKRL